MNAVTAMLNRYRSNWATLMQAAAWLMATLSQFIIDPPRLWPDAQADARQALFVRFVLALLTGFLFIAFKLWSSPRATGAWLALSGAALVGGIALYFSYVENYARWTCPYDAGPPMAVGTSLLPEARDYLHTNPGYSCKELIQDSLGRTNTIWPEQEILSHHRLLSLQFAGLCVLWAVAVMALLQAWKCIGLQPERKSGRKP